MAAAHTGAFARGELDSPRGNHQKRNTGRNTARKYERSNPAARLTSKTPGSSRAADVISDDDSAVGADNGDSDVSGHNEDGDDQADVFALSGSTSTESSAVSRLTGLHSHNFFNDDDKDSVFDTADHGRDDDDDDYAAVAEMSDEDDSIADDNEDSILRMAERDLIQEFELTEKPRNTAAVTNRIDHMQINDDALLARRLSLHSEDSQPDLDATFDLSEDPFRGLSFNDDLYREMIEDAEVAFDDALTRWRMSEAPRSRENSVQSMSQKKVRFESTPSRASSMSSDDDPRDAYPDLFADLEDPSLRQRRNSAMLSMDKQDAESVYDFDFEDECETAVAPFDGESESDDEMSDADSDDDGDTTDEETVDEQLARMRDMQKAKGRPTEHICASATTSITPVPAHKTPTGSRRASATSRFETPKSSRKPRSGTFIHDPTRATVSADVLGSGVKLVCPTNPPEKDRDYWQRARAAMRSRDGSPRGSWTRSTPRAPIIPQQPLTAKSTLGTLFDGNLDFLRNHDVAGITSDLLIQSTHGRARSSFTSTAWTEDDASGDESNVNMADFVQMEDSDSDMDEAVSGLVVSPGRQGFYSDFSMVSSPAQRRGSGGPGLLDHLEQQRGLVTSFRTNQHRARHISSLASDPTKRAQTSEQNALQAGRRNAANTPMTPARKKRASQDLGLTGSGIKKASASPMVARRRTSRGNSLSGIHQTLALDRFNTTSTTHST